MFREPPFTRYDLHFYIGSIPVRIHPMFWLVSFIFGMTGGQPDMQQVLLWVAVVFVSILVHELGHAVVAQAYGYQPHIVLHGFGGLAIYQARHRTRWSKILISLAGPGAGFLLAALVMGVLFATNREAYFFRWDIGGTEPILNPNILLLVWYLLFVNIFWGLVNLLPIYPLDGGQVSRDLLMQFSPGDGIKQSLWLSVIVAGGVAIWGLSQRDVFICLFFGAMAAMSIQELQAMGGMASRYREPWQ